ncbi:MAG: hypothetical protein ACLSFT_00770 [Ruminococcus callidus]
MGTPCRKSGCHSESRATLRRWLFRGAGVLTPDKQGRADSAGSAAVRRTGKDVVVIGANTKAEIWDRARWEALNAAWDPREMLQTLEEIGF